MHDALTRLLEPVRELRTLALVGLLALGSTSMLTIGGTPDAPRRPHRPHRLRGVKQCQGLFGKPPAKRTESISLERRWLVGSFASPAEVDAALGTTIPAWEPFTYMFDSQPRAAIASDIYETTTVVEHQFGRDEYGGIWLVDTTRKPARRTVGPVAFTRDIYLLPVGSSYRGARY